MKLYNTLARLVQDFEPLNPPHVGIYSCGPTVYDNAHIGHMRRYVGDDILVRILKENGYEVKHVMNITDVGHLVSDADTGEDKMEKGAAKYGLSVWDIAKKFEKQFFDSATRLNINRPDVVIRATDAIQDQIELIQILEEKGYTYKTSDGIYFDTAKFPNYFKFSRQNPKHLKAGARVDLVEGKRQPWDFALWKFSPEGVERQMEWESPWGKGFPGWHIECSAMSMRELGPTIDIHTGGIDHIPIHHTNEIAQSEAASGVKFVRYWVHYNFLLVNGQKMAKSLDNFYTVQDIIRHGFDPLALRYLYLQTHYRQEMNFTWESLEAAQNALNNLREEFLKWKEPIGGIIEYEQRFMDALNDDMNTPEALAVLWEMVKSKDPRDLPAAKGGALVTMDKILGLGLLEYRDEAKKPLVVPERVQQLIYEREGFRKQRRFHMADQLRHKINKLGYDIEDIKGKAPVIKKIR